MLLGSHFEKLFPPLALSLNPQCRLNAGRSPGTAREAAPTLEGGEAGGPEMEGGETLSMALALGLL